MQVCSGTPFLAVCIDVCRGHCAAFELQGQASVDVLFVPLGVVDDGAVRDLRRGQAASIEAAVTEDAAARRGTDRVVADVEGVRAARPGAALHCGCGRRPWQQTKANDHKGQVRLKISHP